ncbi:hypothetical protein ACWCPF_40950 [Streptomyces sp. NPDC001858]
MPSSPAPGADRPELVRRLDRRAAGFAGWAREAGPGELWDYSPGSLDRMETVLRDRFADSGGLLAAKSGAFVQGVVRYVGEVVRLEPRPADILNDFV